MNVENQRHTLSGLITNRISEQAFDLFSVLRFPGDDFGASHGRDFQIGINVRDLNRVEIFD